MIVHTPFVPNDGPFRLPADHAVDTLVDLLDRAYPNRVDPSLSTEALLKLAGARGVVDFLRSLQWERDQAIAKE